MMNRTLIAAFAAAAISTAAPAHAFSLGALKQNVVSALDSVWSKFNPGTYQPALPKTPANAPATATVTYKPIPSWVKGELRRKTVRARNLVNNTGNATCGGCFGSQNYGEGDNPRD